MKPLLAPGNVGEGRRDAGVMGYGLGLGLIPGCSETWEWKRVDKEFGAGRGILKRLTGMPG
jgi:hypothetical protein